MSSKSLMLSKVRLKIPLLGGEIEVFLYGVEPQLAFAYEEQILKEGIRLQKIFNFFDKNSELSVLNRNRKSKVSLELLEVMKKSIEFSIITEGLYDVTKGKQFIQRKNCQPVDDLHCSYKDIKITGNTIILDSEDALIDLGSIAKGYIADRFVDFLKELNVACGIVNARGDIANFGNYRHLIQIQNPRESHERILSFFLSDAAVATSGDYNQFYGDYLKSHIVGSKDIISATAVSKKLMEADAAATSIFVLGSEKIPEFAKKIPNIKIATIDRNMKLKLYNGFESLL